MPTAEAERMRERPRVKEWPLGEMKPGKNCLPSMVAFANAGQSLIVFEERLISRHTAQLVRLALDIAEKIIRKTVQEDPQIVATTSGTS